MEKTVQQMFAKRRTNYTLGKDVTLPQEEITARIEAVVREVPSAFNMQSGRIIIAYGSAHDKIWQITKDTLRAVVPAGAFANTEKKIDSFAAAYGTILYYDDTDVVKKLQEQFPLYATNFPTWGPAGQRHDAVCPVDTLCQYGPGCQPAALQPTHRRSPGQ